MTRQKSDGRVVAQGRGNTVSTHPVESGAGAKGSPVNEEVKQLCLHLETAEESTRVDADGEAARFQRRAAARAAPKSRSKRRPSAPATMESVTSRLKEAFEQVARNKGAAGPDGTTIGEVREHLDEVVSKLKQALLDGSCP